MRLQLARLLLQQGRIPEAYPHLFVLTENGVAEAYDSLSVLALRQGRFAEALAYIERAVGLEPNNAHYAEQLANVQQALSA